MRIWKFRKRPVEVEAVLVEKQLSVMELFEWWQSRQNELHGLQLRSSPFMKGAHADGVVIVIKGNGDAIAREGDYIMMGVDGEVYPIKTSVLRKTYDATGVREVS